MNVHVTARDVRTLAEQIANRKAVVAKMYGPMKATNIFKKLPPPPPPPAPAPKAELDESYVQHDAHMWGWRQISGVYLMGATTRYAAIRSAELGFPFAEVTGECCTRDVTAARHLIMWEISKYFGKSLQEIGRLFNRDHSTISYSLNKIQALKDKGEL